MKSALAAVLLTATALTVQVAEGQTQVTANLRAFEEVPAVSSVGKGEFHGEFNEDFTELNWEITIPDLASAVTQAHIHFAQKGVNGGIVVFLCTNLGNGPAGTPACPADGGTVTGTSTAASVGAGAAAQGVTTFYAFQRGVRNGVGYANVHTTQFPGGEVRGQLVVVPTS